MPNHGNGATALRILTERTIAIRRHRDAFALLLLIIVAFAPVLGAMAPRGMAPLVVAGSLLGVAAYRIGRKEWPMPDLAWPVLLGTMIAYGAVTLLWSPAAADGLHQIWQFLYLFGPPMFLIAAAVRAPREADASVRILPAAFAIGTLLLIVRIFLTVPMGELFDWQNMSLEMVLLNRNMVVMTALVWPAMLICWLAGRRGTAMLLPALLALPVMAGESQSAQLGLIAGLLVLALAVLSARLVRLLLAALTAFAFTAVVPAAAWLNEKVLDLQLLPFSFRHRLEIWHFVAERITERPLLGWGLEASRQIGNHQMSDALGWGAELLPLHPHNAFLQIWLELGILGAASTVATMLLLLRCIGRLPASVQPLALAAYASAFSMITVSYGIWQSWWISTMMATILLVAMAVRTAPPQSARG